MLTASQLQNAGACLTQHTYELSHSEHLMNLPSHEPNISFYRASL